jgi:hypothetical protein
LPVTLEIIMDYSEQREQHREDTRYLKWEDGMYVMLDDLLCDYERALVEDSLRRSVYLNDVNYFALTTLLNRNGLGVHKGDAGVWACHDPVLKTKLT